MELSIIIVNFNTRDLVLECLASVEREVAGIGREFATEVFVVDNGSADGSVAAVEETFPTTRVIALKENVGYARGNNAALVQSKGDVVLLLNSDVVLEAGSIRYALDALRNVPSAGAAGIQLLHPDGRLQNSIHAYPSLLRELSPTWLLEALAPERFPSKRRPRTSPIEVESVLGAALFVKREVLELVGLLPEAYFFFLEETDWCLQMRRAGFSVLHVPSARAIHRSGASSKLVDPVATRIEYHRSLYHFMRVNRGVASASAMTTVRVIKQLLSILPLAVLGLFSPPHRTRMRSVARLLLWHAAGQPASWGLSSQRAQSANSDLHEPFRVG